MRGREADVILPNIRGTLNVMLRQSEDVKICNNRLKLTISQFGRVFTFLSFIINTTSTFNHEQPYRPRSYPHQRAEAVNSHSSDYRL